MISRLQLGVRVIYSATEARLMPLRPKSLNYSLGDRLPTFLTTATVALLVAAHAPGVSVLFDKFR